MHINIISAIYFDVYMFSSVSSHLSKYKTSTTTTTAMIIELSCLLNSAYSLHRMAKYLCIQNNLFCKASINTWPIKFLFCCKYIDATGDVEMRVTPQSLLSFSVPLCPLLRCVLPIPMYICHCVCDECISSEYNLPHRIFTWKQGGKVISWIFNSSLKPQIEFLLMTCSRCHNK